MIPTHSPRPNNHEDASSYVAVILAADGDCATLAPRGRPATPVQARLALPAGATVATGDEVVALRCQDGATVVIASLAQRPASVCLADGAVASVGQTGDSLELRTADGALLFRYESGANGRRLIAESDAVTLRAARGDLELQAAGRVVVEGQRVELQSRAPDGARAAIGPEGLALRGRRLALDSEHCEHRAQTTTVHSGELRAAIGHVHARMERLESVARTVVQRAHDLYQEVEGLAQQRAGRLRLLIDATLHVRAQRATTRTEGPYKVRAETIHLG